MTKLETSFFSQVWHRLSILYRDIIPTVHWSSIRAVTRYWCQVTGATNICVDNLRVAERKMWRSCQLRRENESEEWLRWPWLLTSEDGYPEPAEHRGLDTRGCWAERPKYNHDILSTPPGIHTLNICVFDQNSEWRKGGLELLLLLENDFVKKDITQGAKWELCKRSFNQLWDRVDSKRKDMG